MFLKWAEMAWWIDNGDPFQIIYLGEDRELTAVRYGEEVLVCPSKRASTRIKEWTDKVIPSNLILKGFGDLDGKRLGEVMEEGVVYNCALRATKA